MLGASHPSSLRMCVSAWDQKVTKAGQLVQEYAVGAILGIVDPWNGRSLECLILGMESGGYSVHGGRGELMAQ